MRAARTVGAVLLGVGALALVASQLPVQRWVERRLTDMLHAQGFADVALRVARLGTEGIEVRDITIGTAPALVLSNVVVDYSLSGLWRTQIGGVTLDGLSLTGYRRDGQFRVRGLEQVMGNAGTGEGAAFPLPVTQEALARLPVQRVRVTHGAVLLELPELKGRLPVELTFVREPQAMLRYTGQELDVTAGERDIHAAKAELQLRLDDTARVWKGDWRMDGVTVAGAPLPLPPLKAQGSLAVTQTQLRLDGTLQSAARDYHAAFALVYDLAAPERSVLTLTDVRLPWNAGEVGITQATLPLSGQRAKRLTLTARQVSVGALMQALTSERAKGTGTVSGTIPVVITPQGALRLEQGSLNADAPGMIALSPEVIPGDSVQIVMVRDVLRNLHYTVLSARMESAKDGTLGITLSVEGKNPDLAEARPVRLNVHLSGDVLDLVRQNVMPAVDPKRLLEN